MVFTGLGFAGLQGFWPLLLVAFVGTLNPSGGDVSVFLPIEQSLLAQSVGDQDRTALFARYSLAGSLLGALGTLVAALPDLGERWLWAGADSSPCRGCSCSMPRSACSLPGSIAASASRPVTSGRRCNR